MKGPLVVDASVAVKWFLPEVHAKDALRLLRKGAELLAPELILAEVGSVLWKKCRGGELGGDEAGEILAAFRRAPLSLHGHGELLRGAWELSLRHRRSFYDCLYLALALREGGRLVTADRRFFEALSGTPIAPSLLWVEEL